MPTPDTQGVPPFADFDMLKNKINEIVQKYNNLLVNLDSLNVVSLTADHITAGTINTEEITITAADGSKYYKIDGNGIVANNGTNNTLEFDLNTGLLTLLSVLIKSKGGGYPLVVMDPSGDFFGAYMSAQKYIKTFALEGTYGSPALQFRDESVPTYAIMYIDNINHDFNILSPGNIYIGAGFSDITISGNKVRVDSWSSLFSNAINQTLQQALDAKVNQTNANASYAVNMNFDPGTRNLKLFNANGSTIATVNIP